MFARALYALAGGIGLLVAAVGAAAAPEAAIAGVVVGGLTGALVAMQPADPTAARGTIAAVGGPRAGLVTGVAVLTGCLALAGLTTLLGAAGGILIVTLVLVVAAWWWWLQRHDNPHPSPLHGTDIHHGTDIEVDADVAGGHEQLPAIPPPETPARLSTEQLCLAWQRSYFTLLDAPAGPARCHIVTLREGLLDELERRDPDGVARWLDADARANSNPGRYLRADRRPAP